MTLEVDSIELSFAGLRVLRGVSFTAEAGQLLAVVGPNGAGKTSLLHCISGIYRPQAGEVRFDGQRLDGLAPHRIAGRGVARTFQNLGLFQKLTVLENLMLGRHHLYRTRFYHDLFWTGPGRREEIRHRKHVEEVIEFMHLECHRKQPVGALPHGVQKRVELARALCMEPRLLLLDEPAAGLSQEETELMARYLLDVREELEVTLVLFEHNLRSFMDLADHVVVLDFGRKIAEGSPEEMSREERVAQTHLGQGPAPSSRPIGPEQAETAE